MKRLLVYANYNAGINRFSADDTKQDTRGTLSCTVSPAANIKPQGMLLLFGSILSVDLLQDIDVVPFYLEESLNSSLGAAFDCRYYDK